MSYPGFPQVAGRCPSCGWQSLFLGVGGFVTCANLACSNPSEASEVLRAFERKPVMFAGVSNQESVPKEHE